MIGIHDARGHCLYVNDACIDLLGLAPEDMIGKRIHELIHPGDHQLLDTEPR